MRCLKFTVISFGRCDSYVQNLLCNSLLCVTDIFREYIPNHARTDQFTILTFATNKSAIVQWNPSWSMLSKPHKYNKSSTMLKTRTGLSFLCVFVKYLFFFHSRQTSVCINLSLKGVGLFFYKMIYNVNSSILRKYFLHRTLRSALIRLLSD